MAGVEWFYLSISGQQKGPVTPDQLKHAYTSRDLNEECLCWRQGLDGWAAVKTVPQLLTFLTGAPTSQPLVPPPPRRPPAEKRPAPAQDWTELRSAEGSAYFYNRVTGEVTWDRPDCLKDGAHRGADWVWIPDPDEGFVKARVMEQHEDGRVTVETDSARQVTLKKGTPTEKIEMASLRRLEADLVLLDEMTKPLILHNLRERFRNNEIYTNVGSILISINPYKRLPLYTPSIIDDYRNRGQKQLPPHVFVIADEAYSNLIERAASQSIIISGESGSGKTECTKQCLQYLAEVAGSQTNVEQKVLVANPLLEAFGNAKTVRNHNSSRFGKYVEIYFDQPNQICGARTTNYLLEKSRVVYQQPDERNYHIFYLLCAAPEPIRTKYRLRRAENYYYLNQGGDIRIPGREESDEYQEMLGAMDKLEIPQSERDSIFAITAGILHLGDIQYRAVSDSQAEIAPDADKTPVQDAAELFQVARERLQYVVTHRTIAMKGDKPIPVPLSLPEAVAARDALAKFLYAKLFDWLVARINTAMGQGYPYKNKIIGILDIFGFEIFKINSFEQLCINYANEKLQQFFNNYTFKQEEAIYRQEQIDFKHVEYIDNQPVLDLIDKKGSGVLMMVDEELRVPKGTDQTFVDKLHAKHRETAQYSCVVSHPSQFLIKHYAGDVIYDSKDFMVKTRDKMGDDLFDCIMSSELRFIKELFRGESKDDRKSAQDRVKSLGCKFAEQLNDLMTALSATHPHYIRCIKPNSTKAPMLFSGALALEQLTYSGVFEAVETRKRGFPFRLSHLEFYKRFKCVAPHKKFKTVKSGSEELLLIMGESKEVLLGTSRVLYRAPQHKRMELQRNLAVEKGVRRLQRVVRGYLARRLFTTLKRVQPLLKTALTTRTLAACDAALEQCSGLQFPLKGIEECRQLQRVLVEEHRVEVLLEGLIDRAPDDTLDSELSRTIGLAEEIKLTSDVVKRAKAKQAALAAQRDVQKQLQQAIADANEAKLLQLIVRAGEVELKAPDLIASANATLKHINHERELTQKLKVLIESGEGGYQKEGDAISYEALEGRVEECRRCEMRTEEGRTLLHSATTLLELRKRLKIALGSKDSVVWQPVEQIVLRAGEALREHPELVAARGQLAKQAVAGEVALRLERAVSELDLDLLQFSLQQAKELDIDESKFPIFPVAREYLERIATARQLLKASMDPPEEKDLIYAVAYAESFGYDTEEVKKARGLRDAVMQINFGAKFALEILDEDELRDVLKQAERVGIVSADTEKMKTLLHNMSEEKFVQYQLKAAVRLEDAGRITRLTIRLKDIFFKKAGPLFKLDAYPKLRSPVAWAGMKLLTLSREALAAGMRKWQRSPIHASLTELPPKQSKQAVRMFRNIMGFMGDRPYESPLFLAEELLARSLDSPWLRDEIYCQIIKQITANPSEASEQKGWQLLACCLETFPPSSEFENYLEIYLREKADPPERYLTVLHVTVYGGPRAVVPSQSEISRIMHGEILRKHTFERKREIKKPVVTPPARTPIGPPPRREQVFAKLAAQLQQLAAECGLPLENNSGEVAAPLAAVLLESSGSRPGASGTPLRQGRTRSVASPPAGGATPIAPRPSFSTASPAGMPPIGGSPAPPSTPAGGGSSRGYRAVGGSSASLLSPVPPSSAAGGAGAGGSVGAPPSTPAHAQHRDKGSAPPTPAPPPPVAPTPPAVVVSEWQTAFHPQTHAPYYYNTRSGEVTWDKPAELF